MARSRTSFSTGNLFWQYRSKHGRDTLFATPELMWAEAVKYFNTIDNNPLEKEEVKVVPQKGRNAGSMVKRVNIKVKRPYTLKGFLLYIHASEGYLRTFKLTTACTPGFLAVVNQIEQICYSQKFEGAASGFFASNIIAMDLGLQQKTSNENINYNSEPIDKRQMKELSKDLDSEL